MTGNLDSEYSHYKLKKVVVEPEIQKLRDPIKTILINQDSFFYKTISQKSARKMYDRLNVFLFH